MVILNYHKLLNRIIRTKIGYFIWKVFCRCINHSKVRVILVKALSSDIPIINPQDGYFLLPKIKKQVFEGKNILVIVPFYGLDASSIYTDSICRDFKKNGYVIHAIVYNNDNCKPKSQLWDHVYHISSQSCIFGNVESISDQSPDSHTLDDWAGDELIHFIHALSRTVHFKFCIANYIFLSRALTAAAKNTYTIMITHDVFTQRNSRIQKTTQNNKGFYFSTSQSEEKKGLNRSDLVIAIREEDNDYFTSMTEHQNIMTIPYVPQNLINKPFLYSLPPERLKVGFMASAHRPNIDGLLSLTKTIPDSAVFDILVAGSICGRLAPYKLSPHIKLLGVIDDLEKFYENCDIIINPDMVDSGLKIKCVEALSYGKPLICTAPSSAGLNANSKFHLASSAFDVAKLITDIHQHPNQFADVIRDSEKLYLHFREKYGNKKNIAHFEQLANAKE